MTAKQGKKKAQPVTMATIARIAGVTPSTVSRAFNHPELISPETVERIMEAVRLTGYVPNLVAGGLASNRSRSLAAIVPSITNIIYAAFVQNFVVNVRERGYQVMLMESGFSRQTEQELVATALGRRPEGFLLTGVNHSNACRRQLLAADVPVIEAWDLTESPIDICVGFSHAGAAKAAARHLVGRGYRSVAIATMDDERALRRRDAFLAELRAAGIAHPREVTLPGGPTLGKGRQALARLLAEQADDTADTAIFCSSDVIAHGIMIEAQSRGLSVPGDLGVMGFGDQEFAADLNPALTTIRIDRAALGARAAEAMMARIDGREDVERRIDIGFEVIDRASLLAR
ncbi:LacI family DNA-binding transcriptional regulator [Paracoccus ravus]|uniref:LacI family DNA-binding transcriptional regulator n=1 Tax=Paracoccus ravus TaxID=2447760 RepID=UPI001FD71292|nr:LacI family DNA-binding transcriptional regulator [Paracoccus ravus]